MLAGVSVFPRSWAFQTTRFGRLKLRYPTLKFRGVRLLLCQATVLLHAAWAASASNAR